MQVVLLAAGKSSRFYPYNHDHKANFTLLGKTILEHTLSDIKKTGITDVIIVVGKNNSIQESIGDGSQYGLQVRFAIQEESLGMGDALLQAAPLITGDFFVMHGHHIDFSEFFHAMQEKKTEDEGIVFLAKQQDEVKRFGVLRVEGDRVLDLVEKPTENEQFSNLRIIGIYLLNKQFLSQLSQTAQGHYNFEEALATYAKSSVAKVVVTDKPVVSLKYPWDLLSLQRYLLDRLEKSIDPTATIAQNVTINGNVVIGEHVKIMEGVCIKGPCFVGKDTMIGNNAVLRDGVSIGEGCVIGANMEVKDSIIGDTTTTHSGFIGDSVIGQGCKIAAYFVTGNRRLDRKEIRVKTEQGAIGTGQTSFGTILGDQVRTGIRVSTMPGVVIGNRTLVGPSTTVYKTIEDDKIYYTKFQEVVLERREQHMQTIMQQPKDASGQPQKIVLFDIDYTLFDTATFKESNLSTYQIYEEVAETVAKLQEISQLGIFSEGEKGFQETKLEKTNMHEMFAAKHKHIVPRKVDVLNDVLSQYRDDVLFLVDDKLTILQLAKRLLPSVFTIWVKRGPFALNETNPDNFQPDAVVTSLTEIIPLVANTY